MDARQRDQGGKAVDQLRRGQDLRVTAARIGFASVVDQVPGIPLLQPFQRER